MILVHSMHSISQAAIVLLSVHVLSQGQLAFQNNCPACPFLPRRMPGAVTKAPKMPRGGPPQLKHPVVLCQACDQTTHNADTFYEPKRNGGKTFYLHWVKFDSSGAPIGRECYYCFDTRRAHFTTTDENNRLKCPSMDELNQIRSNDPDVEEQYAKRRAAKVNGIKTFKGSSKVEVTRKVIQEGEDFDKVFVSGLQYTLAEFAEKYNVPFLAARIQH